MKILGYTRVSIKGYSLIQLSIILAIIGILFLISMQLYDGYIVKAKLASRLAGVGSEKLQLAENIKKNQAVSPNDTLVIDASDLIEDSKLYLNPYLVNDIIHWSCTSTGLRASQLPGSCTSNIGGVSSTNITCDVKRSISYDQNTKTYNVSDIIGGNIVVVGNFKDINQAAKSFNELLEREGTIKLTN